MEKLKQIVKDYKKLRLRISQYMYLLKKNEVLGKLSFYMEDFCVIFHFSFNIILKWMLIAVNLTHPK